MRLNDLGHFFFILFLMAFVITVLYLTSCAHKPRTQVHSYAFELDYELCEMSPYETLACVQESYMKELMKRAQHCEKNGDK